MVISVCFGHAILVEGPNVSLVQKLERRPLGDDDRILERSVDQDGAGLTVTQQAVRVLEIRPEGDVPVLVVELGRDHKVIAGVRELVMVSQLELDFVVLLDAARWALYSRYAFSGTLK